MDLQAALQGFLLQLQADGRSPHTIGQYRRHGTALVTWFAAALLGEPATVAQIIAETALREAQEELRPTMPKCEPLVLQPKHLKRLGDLGEFAIDTATNREDSTLYLVWLPREATIHPADEDDGVTVPVAHEFMTVADIFNDGRPQADGLSRLLAAPNFRARLEQALAQGP